MKISMASISRRGTCLALLLLAAFTPIATARVPRRQQARASYERAQRLREALTGRAEEHRSRADYRRVIDAFRRVYYIDPASSKADESVRAVAELLAEQGRTFQDSKSFEQAIGQFEFLRKEYPGSRYRAEALFAEAQIYHDDLHQQAEAKQTYEEFLERYPRSHLAEQAQQSLAEINAAGRASKASKKTPPPTVISDATEPKRADRIVVSGVRHWSTPDYTRVAIDVADEVKFEAGRVPSPDRIFFDLHDAKLASELVGKTFEIGDGFLRKIRLAPYKNNTVRIVLDVDDVSEYSAFLLPNPYRLIIDIHGRHPQTDRLLSSSIGEGKEPPPRPLLDTGSSANEIARITQSSGEQKATEKPTSNPVVAKVSPRQEKEKSAAVSSQSAAPSRTLTTDAQPIPKYSDRDDSDSSSGIRAKANAKTRRATVRASAAALPPRTAEPTADGERSLIRALGLKIGRIVVDAGHGGHDTGTIGPNGLLEKDLVLDVALRLGRLLEKNLGAEVVYTRDDDTFVPLETRTAIANKEQADLFISVHANSSSDPAARGIETYYLNFTSSPDALEVAARENAVSEKSIHELQDLVKKIALKDKIEESREFATDIEASMHTSLAAKNAGLKDRGVKKAPFVVLIGANMPSILSEISFVSNPQDEKKLKTPEYRQKIAEALYRGVAKYAGGLSGVKVAMKQPLPAP